MYNSLGFLKYKKHAGFPMSVEKKESVKSI